MATRDFTANQIRTAKVIMTGSATQGGIGHKNLELSVYSESVAPNELGGTPTPSPYSQVGDDASIFISGSQTARDGNSGGLTLFHGDTYISGALVVKNAGRLSHGASISGSIHHTATGDTYLKAGTGITISSGSAYGGQVTITSVAEQNVFTTIDINNPNSGYTWGTDDIVSDVASDTLSLIAGENITLQSDATQDAIKISSDLSLEYYDESTTPPLASPNASGQFAVAIGSNSLSEGGASFTAGMAVTASGLADTSIGFSNVIKTDGSTGEGTNGNLIVGGMGQSVFKSHNSAIIGGKKNAISGSTDSGIKSRYNFIAGGIDNTIDGYDTRSINWGTIVGSNESLIQPAIGGNFQAIYSSDRSKITKGDKSLILGGEENLIDTSKQGSAATGYNTLIGTHLTSSGYANIILGFGSEFSDYQSGNDSVIVSGSFFKSDGLNGGAISGSITRTSEGLSYLVAGEGMVITTASNGQITLESEGSVGVAAGLSLDTSAGVISANVHDTTITTAPGTTPSANPAANRIYYVQTGSNNELLVSVPWEDTNTQGNKFTKITAADDGGSLGSGTTANTTQALAANSTDTLRFIAGDNITIDILSNHALGGAQADSVKISAATTAEPTNTFAAAQYYSFEGPNVLSLPISGSEGAGTVKQGLAQFGSIEKWGIGRAYKTTGADLKIRNSGWIGYGTDNLNQNDTFVQGLNFLIRFGSGEFSKWANVGLGEYPDGIMLRTTIPPGATQMRTHLDFINYTNWNLRTIGGTNPPQADGAFDGTGDQGAVQFLYLGRLKKPGQSIRNWASGSQYSESVAEGLNPGTLWSNTTNLVQGSTNFNKGAWTGVSDGDWHENFHRHSTTTINRPTAGTPFTDGFPVRRSVSSWKNISAVVSRDDTPAANDQVDLIIIRNRTLTGTNQIGDTEDTMNFDSEASGLGTYPSVVYILGVLVEFK